MNPPGNEHIAVTTKNNIEKATDASLEIGENPAEIYWYYRKWWDENESKITLHDPWLRGLEREKID